MSLTVASEGETAILAARVAALLRPGDVLAFDAPMGAGKTTFVRHLAAALGVAPGMVASPTYVLAHEYPTGRGWTLVHIDAYRLRSGEDLDAIGWDRMLAGGGVVVLEWAERVADALPPERVTWLRIRVPEARPEARPEVRPGTEPATARTFVFEGPIAQRLGT
ncbi:MAG: tRNA (adenosine(37)-N6)-threonylcarbamoyltransferase complex ATPase subunit type 1 TsaE [Phycisphaerales bacterium]